jgi:F-type H+-transporting ATPase subunit epsilon
MAAELTLRVITPDRVVIDTSASVVRVPALDGSIGVLRRHAPMVAALAPGELSWQEGGHERHMFVSGGFCEVRDDTVRVISPASEAPTEIDVERAREAASRARERLRGTLGGAGDIDLTRAEAALKRAMMRLSVAERRPV